MRRHSNRRMTTQEEADRVLSEAHREQDISHGRTRQWKDEMDGLIDKAGEGLRCREGKAGRATAR